MNMDPAPTMSSLRANDPSQRVELRGLAPAPLAAALDALALSKNEDRNAYVVKVLEGHVFEELRKASLIVRALQGNPLLTRADGGTPE